MGPFVRILGGLTFCMFFFLGERPLVGLVFSKYTNGKLIQVEKINAITKLSRTQIEHKYLKINIKYIFYVDDVEYVGYFPYFDSYGWNQTDDTNNFLKNLYVGKKIIVWYDWRNPSAHAWIAWEWGRLFFLSVFFIIGCLLMFSGICIYYKNFLQFRK